ncbi:MAG: 2-hydroxychromene-2-carboxylate isomerase [Arenicella sp.]|jgi:2-hydroxychromene-2-carboxylate isomerase
MSEQFKEQGGAATMDPKPLRRWMTSKLLTRLSRESRLIDQRAKTERQRIKSGQAHVVEYFHQVDDAYSHLAAQMLKPLLSSYNIRFVYHIVNGPEGANSAEPDLLSSLSRYDSACVASSYGLKFPLDANPPRKSLLTRASQILAAQDFIAFTDCAADVGRALWEDDDAAMLELSQRQGSASIPALEMRIKRGNARRAELKHYSGGMFYYGGEWYWGVDRLYHLEQRLMDLGINKQGGKGILVPRPKIDASGDFPNAKSLTLEVYPSLRSPYTAVCFDLAIKLAQDTGINLVVRPVLPMVMRGVPATREKGMYIFADAAREARAVGVPFGNFYDPIGEPVRRCYSLYPWACEQGKGNQLLSTFLSAAFAQGINTNTKKGLKLVVEKAGLDWAEATAILGKPGWQDLLEENRQAMYEAGLWGVPSFRLLDAKGEQLLALWGQDRLWLVAKEIRRHLGCDK